MSRRMLRVMPRLVAAFIFANLALLMGCGGSAGVDNGRIVGKVFANVVGSSATRGPLSEVTVVAQREGANPPLIRTTMTDANGNYSFPDLPTGAYVIGFAKEGYKTIDTASGATSQRTAVGNQVRVFIDSGRTSVAPEVTMSALQPSGDATVIVTVRDRTTGEGITDAVVSANVVSTSKNTNGVYTLTVPLIRFNDQDTFGIPRTIAITARAEGFKAFSDQDAQSVRVFPGETTRFLVTLNPFNGQDPEAITVNGTYRFAKFQNLLGRTNNIRLGVRNLSDALIGQINTRIDNTAGTWNIAGLPPSTGSISRQFDFAFEHPDIQTFVLQRQIIPKSGTKTISEPVVLQPLTVNVIGTVTVSSDNGLNIFTPDGVDDQAIIVETGQSALLTAGSFVIPDVPVRQATNDEPWTLRVFATHPTTRNKFKTADLQLRPVINSATPGQFNLGPLQANTVAIGQ